MARAIDIPVADSVIAGIDWPAIADDTGNILLALLLQLEQSQWWPPERLQRAQFGQAGTLLRHAFGSTPYYGKRLGAADYNPDLPLDEESWRKVPLLTREDIQQAGEELCSQALPGSHGKIKNIVNSGSTGKPVELLGTALTDIFWSLMTLRDFIWRRCDLTAKLAAIRYVRSATADYPHGAALPNWGPAFAPAIATGPCSLLTIDTSVAQQAEWLARQDADYLITHPSNLEALIRHCVESGIELARLREVETVSEMLPPNIRALCRERWHVPLVDMYTTQEAGYLALQCPDHEHYHVQSEHVILEILDQSGRPCAPGETGRVVVTDLHNFATPVIRYDIGDYAEAGAPCNCGRGLPVITKILGRQRNMIQLPDGTSRWPLTGYEQYSEIAPIKQYQFVQETREDIEVKFVVERPLRASEEERLKRLINSKLGYPFDLKFTYHDSIPRSAGGKFEDFLSRVES